jgi:hypothetical protein
MPGLFWPQQNVFLKKKKMVPNHAHSATAVLIPVYRPRPTASERFSIARTAAVLAGHPLLLVAPESLDVSPYLSIFPELRTVRFPDPYFRGIPGYNRLLLAPFFYEKFSAYEYVLICQTDVYVFRDDLNDWMQKNYDYIGAPWIETPPSTKRWSPFNFSRLMTGQVGNGGFSLRKVSSHLANARRWACWVNLISGEYHTKLHEDFFWSLLVPRFDQSFRIPPLREALGFAFEYQPAKCFALHGDQLPFAVHAWEKYDPAFWAAHIPPVNS